MIWAIDALQSGRVSVASKFISFPKEAATADAASKYAIHRWELEFLVGFLLSTPKLKSNGQRYRILKCDNFQTVRSLVNNIRAMEDAEARIYLRNMSIFNEMHRISHRQFPWQRGYFNLPQFYRFAYIYGHGMCSEYFKDAYGVTINSVSLVGLTLHELFQDNPYVDAKCSMQELGISQMEFSAVLDLICAPIIFAKRALADHTESAKKRYGNFNLAYRPSIIRRFPIIRSFDNLRLMSPLPELIIQRITSGLYYDLLGGGGDIRNEAAFRFERYCLEFIRATMPAFEIRGSYKYLYKTRAVDSVDIIVKYSAGVLLAIECKARKLTVGAQYSDNPLDKAGGEYDEIIKAVCQLWKYFAHLRLVNSDYYNSSRENIGMVLTMDSWLSMSHELRENVIAEARVRSAKYPEITEADQKSIVFCSIEELERTLLAANEGSFIAAVRHATEARFTAWQLDRVHEETHGELKIEKPFPFDLEDVLPWRKKFGEMLRQ